MTLVQKANPSLEDKVILLLKHYQIPYNPPASTLSTEILITLLLHLHQRLQELENRVQIEILNNSIIDQANLDHHLTPTSSQGPLMVDLPVSLY